MVIVPKSQLSRQNGQRYVAASPICSAQELEDLGSISHLVSAAAVAASSFAMRVTDPTAFLREIDQSTWSKYKEMVNKGGKIRQGKVKFETIPYTEPNFLFALSETRTVYSQSHDGNPTPKKLFPICSKAIVVGDYVDTDAVSDATRMIASSHAEYCLARPVRVPYFCTDR